MALIVAGKILLDYTLYVAACLMHMFVCMLVYVYARVCVHASPGSCDSPSLVWSQGLHLEWQGVLIIVGRLVRPSCYRRCC
jgi:hypothetical protein